MDGKDSFVPGTVKGTAEAIEGVLKAVPVYQDLAQGAVREIGTALQGAVRVALAPVSALVWGYDTIKDYLEGALSRRLAGLSPEQIITPLPTIAGPAIEALRYAGHDPTLREMYANLLAAAMDANRAREAHPAFVDIIGQLTSDEAKIIGLFGATSDFPIISMSAANDDNPPYTAWDIVLDRFTLLADTAECQVPENVSAYIDNICRLGLADVLEMSVYSPQEEYDKLMQHPTVKAILDRMNGMNRVVTTQTRVLNVTTFGKQFRRACVG
jgi:hypothetical protein